MAPVEIQLTLPAQLKQNTQQDSNETQPMEVDLTNPETSDPELMEVDEPDSEIISVLPVPPSQSLPQTVSKVGPGFKGKLKSSKRKAEDGQNPKTGPKR